MKKVFVILCIFFLLLPLLSVQSFAQDENVNNDTTNDSTNAQDETSLINQLLKLRFRITYFPFLKLGPYYVRQLRPPVPIQASSSTITVRYNEKSYFDIGGVNPDTGEYEKMILVAGPYSFGWLNKKVAFSFEVEEFENSSMDVWSVEFDPPVIELYPNRKNLDWPGAEIPLRTNVSIMLNSNNVDPSNLPQDTILKINIVREELLDKAGILRGTPDYGQKRLHPELFEEYVKKETEIGAEPYFKTGFGYPIWFKTLGQWFIFLLNRQLPPYDKFVDSVVEVLVNVKRYHQAEIEPPETFTIEPYAVRSIPLTIKNLGSHIDTFNFRVTSKDENIIVTPPPSVTLRPGEEAEALVGVAAPKTLYSLGATTPLLVEAYSVNEPESVFSNTLTLQISGINVAGQPMYYFIGIIVLIAIFFALLLYLMKKRAEKLGMKPQKPWTIPAEKEHLLNLKKKDIVQYEKERKMMEEEYQSALLTYHEQSTPKKKTGTPARATSFQKTIKSLLTPPKKSKKQPAKKPKKKIQKPTLKAKPKIKSEPKLKKKEPKLEPKQIPSDEQRRKQEALRRIQREQNKLKKKK